LHCARDINSPNYQTHTPAKRLLVISIEELSQISSQQIAFFFKYFGLATMPENLWKNEWRCSLVRGHFYVFNYSKHVLRLTTAAVAAAAATTTSSTTIKQTNTQQQHQQQQKRQHKQKQQQMY